MYIGASQTKQYALAVGGQGWDITVMTAISGAESGWNTTARSPTDDWGLFQINKYYWGYLFNNYYWANGLDNTRMAWIVFQQQGYRAWSTYNNGDYRQYLQQAADAYPTTTSTGGGGGIVSAGPGGPAAGQLDWSGTVGRTATRLSNAFNDLHVWGNFFKTL